MLRIIIYLCLIEMAANAGRGWRPKRRYYK
nr:MAG TPA: hypothetical protein [Inoviridae sp.]